MELTSVPLQSELLTVMYLLYLGILEQVTLSTLQSPSKRFSVFSDVSSYELYTRLEFPSRKIPPFVSV